MLPLPSLICWFVLYFALFCTYSIVFTPHPFTLSLMLPALRLKNPITLTHTIFILLCHSIMIDRTGFSKAASGARKITNENDVAEDFYNFMQSFLKVSFLAFLISTSCHFFSLSLIKLFIAIQNFSEEYASQGMYPISSFAISCHLSSYKVYISFCLSHFLSLSRWLCLWLYVSYSLSFCLGLTLWLCISLLLPALTYIIPLIFIITPNFLSILWQVFPEFQGMPVYITGESYAGMYIPWCVST